MKITLLLVHPDEVSGTFIFDDGVKLFFGEGPCSGVTIAHPNGQRASHNAGEKLIATDWYSQYAYLSDRYGDDDSRTADSRQMTEEEIEEWNKNID